MNKAAEIEAQAASWVARTDRQAGGGGELSAWLAADPRHRAAYLRLAEAWRRSEQLERLRPTDSAIDPDLLAPAQATSATGGFRLWRIRSSRSMPKIATGKPLWGAFRPNARRIASAVAIAAAAAVVWWTWVPVPTTTYRTGAEGLEHIVLADGSSVIMNSDTEVQVRLSADKRAIVLERGEAHFVVAHDTHRPFEVYAGDRVVLAVGTAFDVRRDASQLEVSVTEGRVALIAAPGSPPLAEGPPPTLSAGEVALIGPSKLTIRRPSPSQLSRSLSWEHRELIFHGDSLEHAVTEFNSYNYRKIVVEDPGLNSLEIGGNFQALDGASFVAALERSFAISARTSADGTIYLSRAATR